MNNRFPDQVRGCFLVFFIIAAGAGGCRSLGGNKQSTGSTIDKKKQTDIAKVAQPANKEDTARSEYQSNAPIFNSLFGEDYYEEPKRHRQFVSEAEGFIAKQMFMMAAVTPKKRVGVVEFFDESGENLTSLQKGFARYLTEAFRRTQQIESVPPSMISQLFQEELENRNLRVSSHNQLFDKIIAGRALEMGFNILCLGTFIEAEIHKVKETGQKYSSILKLHYRIIALDTLSARVTADFLGELETGLKMNQETLQLKDLKISMLDENHLRAFCNNLVNKIMAEFHTREWFARVMEKGEPDEESRELFIVNTGEDSGVNIGDRLLVYRAKTAPIDPSSGRYLFDRGALMGELVVTEYLDKDRCKAAATSGINIQPDDLVVLKYWQH